jgi:hypothetical protein
MLVQFEDGPAVINPGLHHYQNQTDPIIDHDHNFDLLLNAYKSAPVSPFFALRTVAISRGLTHPIYVYASQIAAQPPTFFAAQMPLILHGLSNIYHMDWFILLSRSSILPSTSS